MKTIQQRFEYHDRKGRELDKITDPYKYTRKLERLMKYHCLISKEVLKEVYRVTDG